MMKLCTECSRRKAIHGQTICQKCERTRIHGPVHEPRCVRCSDSGRIEAGTCDIPGCRHWYPCNCAAGRAKLEQTPQYTGGGLRMRTAATNPLVTVNIPPTRSSY